MQVQGTVAVSAIALALVLTALAIRMSMRTIEPAPIAQLYSASPMVRQGGAQSPKRGLGTSTVSRGSSPRASTTPSEGHGYLEEDHYAYIERLIGSARRGDPRSKFEVWKALIFCQRDAHAFRGRTPSEVINALSAPYPHEIQRVQETFALCGRFYTEGSREFDDTVQFRFDAANAGYPPAVVDVALGELVSGMGDDVDHIEAKLLDALSSGSPEALVSARLLQGLNVIDEGASIAFVLAGCDLGYDCTRGGPLMKEVCWSTPVCDDSYASLMEKRVGHERFEAIEGDAAKLRSEISDGRAIDPSRFHWHALDKSRFQLDQQQLLKATTRKSKSEG
jgi:hypothetical protein